MSTSTTPTALQEIMAGLKSGEIPAKSELNIMNEKRQDRVRGVSFKNFKWEWKKKSRILIALQLAVPFNPETGTPDTSFNADSKWRPPFSATTAALVCKAYANQNEEVKKSFMNRAGVSEWDTSDLGSITDGDKAVLRKYRVPIILTADTIGINDEMITGQKFNIRYAVTIETDPVTGFPLTDKLPDIAKIGNLMNEVIFNEVSELKKAVTEKDVSIYKGNNKGINASAIPSVDEDTHKKWNKAIFDSAIISSPAPANFIIGYEYPLSNVNLMKDDKGVMLPDYLAHTKEDLKSHEVIFNSSKKYTDYIKNVLDAPALDYYWDFVEFDLCDNTALEPKTQDEKARASGDLKPSASSHSMYDIDRNEFRFDWVSGLIKGFIEHRDSDPDFEKKMAQFLAGRLKPADDDLTDRVAERLKTTLPLGNRYIDSNVLKRHKDALYLVYGEEYLTLSMEKGVMDEPDALPAPEAEPNTSTGGILSVADIMQGLSSEAVAADTDRITEVAVG